MKPIYIFVVSKFLLTYYAINYVLQELEKIKIEFIPNNDNTLIDKIRSKKPDMIIVEIVISYDIIKLLREIKKEFPKLKIIVLVDASDIIKLPILYDMELNGYISKYITKEELQIALIKINNNEKYLSKDIKLVIYDFILKKKLSENLSRREHEILFYIVDGMSNKEIARLLNISEFTVMTHRRNIMRKLNVKNTSQLIIESIKRELVILIKDN
ncbi:response regulator transcription factor [Rosettibacter firmus]|uniref:response regulator transcription factor n=1 Tax=Rosettibacter firmus TaxID=3111522 RepID=UPI00336C1587